MANQTYIAPGGVTTSRKSDGTGTDGDPFIPYFKENSAGSTSDSASATGSIHGKWGYFFSLIGAIADAASTTGSLLARLRYICENLGGSAAASYAEFANAAVSIGTSLTTVSTIDCRSYKWLAFQLYNTGATDLNAFQVQIRFSSNASNTAWNPITFSAADFTTGSGKQSGNSQILVVEHGTSSGSGSIYTLPATNNAWVRVRLDGIESVRLQASVATGATTVSAYGVAK